MMATPAAFSPSHEAISSKLEAIVVSTSSSSSSSSPTKKMEIMADCRDNNDKNENNEDDICALNPLVSSSSSTLSSSSSSSSSSGKRARPPPGAPLAAAAAFSFSTEEEVEILLESWPNMENVYKKKRKNRVSLPCQEDWDLSRYCIHATKDENDETLISVPDVVRFLLLNRETCELQDVYISSIYQLYQNDIRWYYQDCGFCEILVGFTAIENLFKLLLHIPEGDPHHKNTTTSGDYADDNNNNTPRQAASTAVLLSNSLLRPPQKTRKALLCEFFLHFHARDLEPGASFSEYCVVHNTCGELLDRATFSLPDFVLAAAPHGTLRSRRGICVFFAPNSTTTTTTSTVAKNNGDGDNNDRGKADNNHEPSPKVRKYAKNNGNTHMRANVNNMINTNTKQWRIRDFIGVAASHNNNNNNANTAAESGNVILPLLYNDDQLRLDENNNILFTLSDTLIRGKYILVEKIGHGGFAQIFRAVKNSPSKNFMDPAEVAVKIVRQKNCEGLNYLHDEFKTLRYLSGHAAVGIPKVLFYTAIDTSFYALGMQLLGPSLLSMSSNFKERKCPIKFVMHALSKALMTIEYIHSKGFVHRDIKPENFAVRVVESSSSSSSSPSNEHNQQYSYSLYLIDFGLATKYVDADSCHIVADPMFCPVGTLRYMSQYVHEGFHGTRRDDLQSLIYMASFLSAGRLPWQSLSRKVSQNTDLNRLILETKRTTTSCQLFSTPIDTGNASHDSLILQNLVKVADYVAAMEFEQKPNYSAIWTRINAINKMLKIDVLDQTYAWNE